MSNDLLSSLKLTGSSSSSASFKLFPADASGRGLETRDTRSGATKGIVCFLATTHGTVTGLTSEAFPILTKRDPGCMMITCEPRLFPLDRRLQAMKDLYLWSCGVSSTTADLLLRSAFLAQTDCVSDLRYVDVTCLELNLAKPSEQLRKDTK